MAERFKPMKVAFRCDASIDVGTGHVMRCLTLADEIIRNGATSHFICRDLPGHLVSTITAQGHGVTVIGDEHEYANTTPALAGYAAWLGVSPEQDAAETAAVLRGMGGADWLVADHYAIARPWEDIVAPYVTRLMVIDDLADRAHRCDLLLDQTYGRQEKEYRELTGPNAMLLCGSQYALLRPEFREWRAFSLKRRSAPGLRNILITMGGMDRDNVTGAVLESLETSTLAAETSVTVVMGKTAPWLAAVVQKAAESRLQCRVLSGVNNMAQLMSEADLAIGAVGSTSWERCALGLPAIVCVLAENQEGAADVLQRAGAALLFTANSTGDDGIASILEKLAQQPERLLQMSGQASVISDGAGCSRVWRRLFTMENAA